MKKIFLLFLAGILMTPCWGQNETPTYSYKEFVNLSYLEKKDVQVDSLQQLNLVIPEGVENPPLLLWIGGGAWSFVNRHQEMALARKFAEAGIAVASVGHRLSKGSFSPQGHDNGIKHPEHIKDVAAAFSWLKEEGQTYGYDSNNIYVSGFSSGAHLAALLGTDGKYLKKHGLKTSDIRAIIPVAGAYDINDYYQVFFTHEDPNTQKMAETHVMDVFGETQEDLREASVTTYLDQLKLPMLLISEGDLFNYTKLFEERLWESEYRDCQILHLFNFGHASLWRDMSNAKSSQARNAMVDFIQRNKSNINTEQASN